MISLTRLEKQIQLNEALGQGIDETMKYLAGLRRIEYVFVYPETGDLVVAGPAGDWTVAGENRVVSCETGDPVVRLDDLVVVFRHMMSRPRRPFRLHDQSAPGIAEERPGIPDRAEQAVSFPQAMPPARPGASSSAPRSASKTSRSSADWIRRPGRRARWSRPTIA